MSDDDAVSQNETLNDAVSRGAATGTTLDAAEAASGISRPSSGAIHAQRLANLRPFPKGTSGNPNGRPKAVLNVARLARTHTRAAIETLAEIMTDPDATPSARVAAASVILDRGHGKAAQVIDLRDGGGTPLEGLDSAVLGRLLEALRLTPGRAAPLDVTPQRGALAPAALAPRAGAGASEASEPDALPPADPDAP